MLHRLVRCTLLLAALVQCSSLEESSIVYGEPNLSTTISSDHGEFHLDAFKASGNDRIMETKGRVNSVQLHWFSLGEPRLVPPNRRKPASLFDFKFDRVGITISILTAEQRQALAAAAQDKFRLEVSERQFQQLPLSSVKCEITMSNEAGQPFLLTGSAINLQRFPVRVDFPAPQNTPARQLLQQLIESHPDGLKVDCTFYSKGREVRKNTLELLPEQIDQLEMIPKLFGPSDAVFVTREQLTALASEMYSALSILEEYTMPLHQFGEAFTSELLRQTMNTSFSFVDVDKALGGLSLYGLQTADTSEGIKKALSSIFSVRNVGNQTAIVLNKPVVQALREHDAAALSDSSTISLFGIQIGPSRLLSAKEIVSPRKSIDDQLTELNSSPESDVHWSRDKHRLVPRSLQVVGIWRRRFKRTLRFSRIFREDIMAPFARKVRMEIAEAAMSSPEESRALQDEKNEIAKLQADVGRLLRQQNPQEYVKLKLDVDRLTKQLQQQPRHEVVAKVESLANETAEQQHQLLEEHEQLETVQQKQQDQLQGHGAVIIKLKAIVSEQQKKIQAQQEAMSKLESHAAEMAAAQQDEPQAQREQLEQQLQKQQAQLTELESLVLEQQQQLQQQHLDQGTLLQTQQDQLHRLDDVIGKLAARVEKQQQQLQRQQDQLRGRQDRISSLELRLDVMLKQLQELQDLHNQVEQLHLTQQDQQKNLTKQQQQLLEEWQRLPILRKTLTAEEKKLIKDWEAKWNERRKEVLWQNDTILGFASFEGDVNVVKALIINGEDINGVIGNGRPPLHLASMQGNTEVVTLLIQNGADINRKDNFGWTPLHQASWNGKADTVRVLVQNGADVDRMDKQKTTALYWASWNGNTDVASLLIENGADINHQDTYKWTPLHTASEKGKVEIVKLLIQSGADVDRTDIDGWTPLHRASEQGQTEIVRVLLENNADKDIEDKNGNKARDVICTYEYADKSQYTAISRLLDK